MPAPPCIRDSPILSNLSESCNLQSTEFPTPSTSAQACHWEEATAWACDEQHWGQYGQRTCRQTSQVPGASTIAAMAPVKPALYSSSSRVWFRLRTSCNEHHRGVNKALQGLWPLTAAGLSAPYPQRRLHCTPTAAASDSGCIRPAGGTLLWALNPETSWHLPLPDIHCFLIAPCTLCESISQGRTLRGKT